jgi:cytoskeletal protein RodZ
MNRKTSPRLSLFSFGALAAICLGSAPLVASAQGWRVGEPKTNATSKPREADQPAVSRTTSTKTARASKVSKTPRTNATAAKSGEPKSKPASAKTTTAANTQATKASRARLVNHNNNTGASATNAAGSTRVAAATKARSGRCDPDQDERIDLSGTYRGNVTYPAGGLSGDATLTVSGYRFILRAGSRTESGNITAVTTCSYTAVAMMFGEWRTPKPGEPAAPPLPMLSLTAVRNGDQLTLKSSPSERREFSFVAADKK